jgi:hypothetical protein
MRRDWQVLMIAMSHPHYHSKSSARRFGGVASDYHAPHEWFDQVKAHLPDVRHRAVLHSSFGIFLAQQVFGEVIFRKSDGAEVPTRLLGEQHVLEDLGFIPTVQDWLKGLPMRAWMIKGAKALEAEAAVSKARKSARKPAARKATVKRRRA